MTDAEMEAQGWTRLAKLEAGVLERFENWELTYTRPGTENQIDQARLLASSKEHVVHSTYGFSTYRGRLFFKGHQLPRDADVETWVRPVLAGGGPVKLWRKQLEIA